MQQQQAKSDIREWKSSPAQISRDMSKIFGKDWSKRRMGGGRGRDDGRIGERNTSGLAVPEFGHLKLMPNRKPTTLLPCMENRIINSLKCFEKSFGCGIITPVLIKSIAIHEILGQLPEGNYESDSFRSISSSAINIVIRQLSSVKKISWICSFLNCHKAVVRRKSQRRALETYKEAKHQIKPVLCHFKNVYQAEAIAQIQRHLARTGNMAPGFVLFTIFCNKN